MNYTPVESCTLYNENCLDTLKRGISYDFVITSPPDFDEIGENPAKSKELWENLMKDAFSTINPTNNVVTVILRDRKSDGTVVRKHQFITNLLESLGWKLKTQKIWVRSYSVNLYRFNYSFILTFKRSGKQFKKEKGEFNEQKIPDVIFNEVKPIEGYVDNYPIELLCPFVKAYTDENQTVFDPFMGSGSTAEICIKQNRHWIGSELVTNVYDIAVNRLSAIYDERKHHV